jgi:hypothetical protein
MAVLAEAISVIIRHDAIERVYAGGWHQFLEHFPIRSLCSDSQIVRLGFMEPKAVEACVRELQSQGLVFLRGGMCIDIVVVDQQKGPTEPCDWIEFDRLPFGNTGEQVSACWLLEGRRMGVGIPLHGASMGFVAPDGWEYEGSISQKFTFVLTEDADTRLQLLRSEDGVDVFLDILTGKEVFRVKPYRGRE